MKKSLLKFSQIIIILAIYLLGNSAFAQDPSTATLSKDELKLIKLEEKVKNIETKISLTEAKIEKADSLVNAGYEMAMEANSELKIIGSEEKSFLKENNEQRKILVKRLRKADEEDTKLIETKLKALQTKYKNEIKSIDKRYSTEDKKLIKAKSNDTKGKEKLKQYNLKLKEYQKALEIAQENLEAFKTEKDL
jgi:hypothetical protein